MQHEMETKRPLMNRVKAGILSIDFWLGLSSFALLTYLIWGFDHIDRLYDSIALNLAAALIPVAAFTEAIRPIRHGDAGRRFSWLSLSLVICVGLLMLVTIGVSSNLDAVATNAAVILATFPWAFMFVYMVSRKRVLAVGMIPASLILLLYLIVTMFPDGVELNVVSLPLAPVALIAALWTLPVWVLFMGVDKWRKKDILGPLLESVAMFFLAAPSVALAMLIVGALPFGDIALAIAGIFAGLIFSSAVSEPFKEFLGDLGNLPGNSRSDGPKEAEQGQDRQR